MEESEEEKILQMNFTLSEMNIILKALSKEPFKDVFQLIGKINDAASQQLNNTEEINHSE